MIPYSGYDLKLHVGNHKLQAEYGVSILNIPDQLGRVKITPRGGAKRT